MPLDFLVAAKAIGSPIAEFLLKHFLGEGAAAAGKGLIEIAGKVIEDGATQYEAKIRFEELASKVVKQIQPLFRDLPDNDAEAIAYELGATLSQSLSVELIIEKDLDPAKITAAFRTARPLPRAVFGTDETALYNRALDETARYMVGIANKLPRFEPTAVGAVLGRLSRMGGEIDQILDSIARIEQALAGGNDEAVDRANRFESDYRQAVINNLDFLELFGADLSEEARRHRLSVGYISLTISASDSGEAREALNAERLFGMLAAGSGRLLIRGEAGSGKSTLLRWAAIESASLHSAGRSWFRRFFVSTATSIRSKPLFSIRSPVVVAPIVEKPTVSITDSLRTWLSFHRDVVPSQDLELASDKSHLFPRSFTSGMLTDRIPFLVRLRDCKEGKLPSPEELPAQIARELGHPPEEWVQSVLNTGRGLVLFDGVDEVPNSKREEARSGIRAIVRKHPKCWYIVTTRPTAVGQGWLKPEGFTEAEIIPLSDTDRIELIRRWHHAVEDELSRQGRPEDLGSLGDHLIEMLAETPPLARLATNPLLCAVMCALHRDRRQVLPESQGELCEAICSLLLHRREAEAGIPLAGFPTEYTALKYKQKRAVLQTIAHHMVDNEESTIAEDDAITCANRTLRRFPDVDETNAGVVLKALIERSGMLRERRQGIIDYVHNTLRDFLAAEVFVENNDIPKLARHATDDSWRQVVRFAASTDNRIFATKLVERILKDAERTSNPETSRQLRLAAVDCRYAALNMEPSTVSRINVIERSLVPPQTMADAEALAASGDAVVSLLQYREMTEECAAASVRALRLAGTEHAQRVLRGYFADRRPSVIAELCQAVNPLLLEFVQDQLRADGNLPEAIARQVNDLRPLAEIPELERLDLSGWNAVQDITPLRTLRNLKSLYLPAHKIADLSPVLALSSLTALTLHSPRGSELLRLPNCEALRELRVSDIGDSELKAISNLIRLGTLEIRDAKADQWAELGKLGNLRGLRLHSCSSLGSLEFLAAFNDLSLLDLQDCEFDDLAPVGRLPRLERFIIAGKAVDAPPNFTDQSALSFLGIFDTSITDLCPIGTLAALKALGIFGTPVSDLRPISNLRGLEELVLRETRATNLGPLASLSHLKRLDIGQTEVGDFAWLCSLRELESLALQHITPAIVAALVCLPNLTKIAITNPVSEDVLRPLKERGVTISVLGV
jgi:Leucine-rich repeat (LRR) protein